MRARFVFFFVLSFVLVGIPPASAQDDELSQLIAARSYQEYVAYHFHEKLPLKTASKDISFKFERDLPHFEAAHEEPLYLDQTAIAARKIIPVGPDMSRTGIIPINKTFSVVTINLREGCDPQRRLAGVCIVLIRNQAVHVTASITARIDQPLEEGEPRGFAELHISF